MLADSTTDGSVKSNSFFTLRKFLNLFLVIILFVTIFIAYIIYLQMEKFSAAQRWVTHSYKVMKSVDDILIGVLQAESYVRGFVISNDNDFLDQLSENLASINTNYIKVKDLVKDNSSQTALIESLKPVLELRIKKFQDYVKLKKIYPTNNSKMSEFIRPTEQLTMQIKYIIKEMYNNELELLRIRERDYSDNLDFVFAVVLTAKLIVIILLLLIIFIFNYLTKKMLNAQASESQSQSLLKSIINGTSEFIAACDLNYKFLAFNAAFEAEFKKAFGKRAMIGSSLIDALDHVPQEQKKAKALWSRALNGEEYTIVEEFGADPSHSKQYEISFSSIYNNQNQLIGASHVVRDVSERMKDEFRLKTANRTLESAIHRLENRGKEMQIMNEMNNVLASSDSLKETLAMIPNFLKRLLPFSAGLLYVMNDSKNALECMEKWNTVRANVDTFNPEECWGYRQGKIYCHFGNESISCKHYEKFETEDEQLYCMCVPMLAKNDLLGILYIELQNESKISIEQVHQIIEDNFLLIQNVAAEIAMALSNIKLHEAFKVRSTRDSLTNLYNRSYLHEILERDLYQAKRNKFSLAFVMIDLDLFKNINDKYGHDSGDEVLIQVANLFKNNMRKSDLASRYGGEEFLIILYNTSIKDALSRLEILRQSISNLKFNFENDEVSITASFGVAMYPDDGEDPEKIIKAADIALYQSKAAGRNRITVYQEVR